MYRQILTKWMHTEYMWGHLLINKCMSESGDLKLMEMGTELIVDACLMQEPL